jgi:hypothetical protein
MADSAAAANSLVDDQSQQTLDDWSPAHAARAIALTAAGGIPLRTDRSAPPVELRQTTLDRWTTTQRLSSGIQTQAELCNGKLTAIRTALSAVNTHGYANYTRPAALVGQTPVNFSIWRVMLTGGPGAGKTYAIEHLPAVLESAEFLVFTSSEGATHVMENTNINPNDVVPFQTTLFRYILSAEQDSLDAAAHAIANWPTHSDRRHVAILLLTDRGCADGKFFTDETHWNTVLSNEGVTETAMLHRYKHPTGA